MKQACKKILRALYGLTAFVRRPLKRKLQRFVLEVCSPMHSGWNGVYEQHLVLNSLVRELARLQNQIDFLQHTVAALTRDQDVQIVADTAAEQAPPLLSRAG